jgi:hypothetical protein
MIKKHLPAKPQEKWGENIVYYCKDCEKVVDAKQFGRKYVYKCADCGTKNVAFGTPKSVKSFFHIEEEKEKKTEEPAKS